ncbi:AzlC family ABC transporter permease [Tropicimonas sp. IMCC34043]|uniref:AzlC family ABC transporter permease n=1 Tax=Tropicimonas sp. IMCC34043 TaxID=2248760 RepID=UPI000E27AE61|nr:AzlC family ABC transporter permease [Tropicimonas sp. IMCC34043]
MEPLLSEVSRPGATASGAEFRAGLREVMPLALGVAIYGLAFGLLAAQARMDGLATGIMGAVVFAGSSQIVAVERVVTGAGAAAALAAGIALNLRLLLITASLREELSGRPWWQILLGVHLATDENWALMHATRARGRAVGYWYLVGGGVGIFAAWVAATATGAMLAGAIPEPRAFGLDFAFVAAFVAILRNLWRGSGDALPWGAAVGATAALVLVTPIEPSWALACGGVAGAVIAGLRRGRDDG